MLGKIKVSGSDRTFSFDVPLDFGGLILEAFVDTNGDGPGPGDLMGIYQENPLQIQSMILMISILLSPFQQMEKCLVYHFLLQNNLRCPCIVYLSLNKKMYRLSE